uniref:Synaptic plasticity regulator PANTS n=1 Tax=Mus musculus TaxID=10090 RepID=A0A087WSL9_MOUSE
MAVAGSWQPPRPCEVYRAEWELCRSVGHVLHHYYVHGKRPDCRQWLRDLTNCREWEESRSAEAQGSQFFQLIFTLMGPSLQLEDKGRILGRL